MLPPLNTASTVASEPSLPAAAGPDQYPRPGPYSLPGSLPTPPGTAHPPRLPFPLNPAGSPIESKPPNLNGVPANALNYPSISYTHETHTNGHTNWNSKNATWKSVNPRMAAVGGTWSDAEKIHLLVEVLRDVQAAPNWHNVHVPGGRTPFEAQELLVALTSSPSPLAQQIPRKPRSHDASIGQTPGPAPYAAPPPGATPHTSVTTVNPGYVPVQVDGTTASYSATTFQPKKRKRGRPSKADLKEREEAAARGEIPLDYRGLPLIGPDGQVIKRRRGRPSKADTEARKEAERKLQEQSSKHQGGGSSLTPIKEALERESEEAQEGEGDAEAEGDTYEGGSAEAEAEAVDED